MSKVMIRTVPFGRLCRSPSRRIFSPLPPSRRPFYRNAFVSQTQKFRVPVSSSFLPNSPPLLKNAFPVMPIILAVVIGGATYVFAREFFREPEHEEGKEEHGKEHSKEKEKGKDSKDSKDSKDGKDSKAAAGKQLPAGVTPELAALGFDGTNFNEFKVKQILPYNHNASVFVFELPDSSKSLKLPVASCVAIKTKIDGKEEIRNYTPIDANVAGAVHFLIKRYEQGKVSKYVHNLKVGDKVLIKGPRIKIPYTANMKKSIGMVAGGTGITPMLQVINEVLSNPADKTQISLVFANVSPDDILLKERLDALMKKHSNFKVTYTVDKAPAGSNWKGPVGFISADLLKKNLPSPSMGNDALIMVCGPDGMMKHVSGETDWQKGLQGELLGLLKDLKYKPEQVFKF